MDLDRMVNAAITARDHAHAPHSHFYVGAALLTHTGQLVAGCNVENASYSLTICAERVAATASIAVGDRNWRAIAIASVGGAMPCGACRQFLAEFGMDLLVVTVDVIDNSRQTRRLSQLLPDAFTPADVRTT
ncbi:MAG: cytidine deaminase [Planctomycetota bacterium]